MAWLLGIALATIGAAVWVGLPVLPLVGAAVAAAAVTVRAHSSKIARHTTCLTCGRDLDGEPISAFGVACPGCGAVHQPPRRPRA